jgi:hypothetical protein
LALFEKHRVAKLAPGCPSCILPAHALANKPLRQEFNVRLDFVAELTIRFSLTEEAAKPGYELKDQRSHDYF